jgi:hypothetical protein
MECRTFLMPEANEHAKSDRNVSHLGGDHGILAHSASAAAGCADEWCHGSE